MSQQFKVFRETALPSTLQAYAMYLIAPTDKADYVELYVTDSTGRARRHFNEADVRTLIAQELTTVNQLTVVSDINARNAIPSPKESQEVYVINASADTTVNSGGAKYLYHNNQWLKIAETESMDLNLLWSAIEGKPNSSPTQIDAAVAAQHTHTNKTQLDKIAEDAEGNMTYGGKSVATSWSSTGW